MSVKDRQKKMHRVQQLSHRVKAGRLSTPQNYQRMRKWQMHTGMQASRCKSKAHRHVHSRFMYMMSAEVGNMGFSTLILVDNLAVAFLCRGLQHVLELRSRRGRCLFAVSLGVKSKNKACQVRRGSLA